MPLETATYISDLVSTNPIHTDGLAQTDSHLRLIKEVLQNTFPNANAPITANTADLSHGYVPIGGIVLWSGTVASIPANWHLCDGTSGTVDLRARFVIGSDSDTGTYPHGTTGGQTGLPVVTDSQGAHSHGGSSASYTLLATDIPSHTHPATVIDPGHVHGIQGAGASGGVIWPATSASTLTGGAIFNSNSATTGISVTVGGNTGGGGHAHGISSDGAHTHSVTPPLPPFFALAFIQRIS